MPTQVLTPIQARRIAGTLTALAVSLSELGFPWPDEARRDLEGAFSALGLEMPLTFVERPSSQPAQPAEAPA